MAMEPVVKIDGNQIDKVLTVHYGIVNGSDADGRPTKTRRSIGITVTRVADDNKDVAAWAKQTSKDARKGGTIEFQYNDGGLMKTLTWDEGYISGYNLGYDIAQAHAVEIFTIMPRSIDIEGTSIDYEWETHH